MKSEIARNNFGDLYPQYFFPYIDGNEYLTWKRYRKMKPFKGISEFDARSHWEMTTGVPPLDAPDEITSRMDELQLKYLAD